MKLDEQGFYATAAFCYTSNRPLLADVLSIFFFILNFVPRDENKQNTGPCTKTCSPAFYAHKSIKRIKKNSHKNRC